MSERAHWQVQEAKQRFSEVLRAVESDGPQTITRHGADVAVIIDIEEYRRLRGREESDFIQHILAFPKVETTENDVFDEIENERRTHLSRSTDFDL